MKSILATLLTSAALIAVPAAANTLDLRNQTDGDGSTREISFCARPSPDKPGLPGHAFLIFAVLDNSGVQKFRTLGHTVFAIGDALLSYGGLIPASGALVQEKYTSTKQECLTVQVNAADFNAAYATAAQPLSKIGIVFDEALPIQKAYSLGVEDCVQFLVSVASRFIPKGLKVPTRNTHELPLSYVRRLIDTN